MQGRSNTAWTASTSYMVISCTSGPRSALRALPVCHSRIQTTLQSWCHPADRLGWTKFGVVSQQRVNHGFQSKTRLALQRSSLRTNIIFPEAEKIVHGAELLSSSRVRNSSAENPSKSWRKRPFPHYRGGVGLDQESSAALPGLGVYCDLSNAVQNWTAATASESTTWILGRT